MQICHSVININREVQEHQRRQHRAASVIQKAVRRFLLRREQERLRTGVVKMQVTDTIVCLVPDLGWQFIYRKPDI